MGLKKILGMETAALFSTGCTTYFIVVTGINHLTDFEGFLSVFYGAVLTVYGLLAGALALVLLNGLLMFHLELKDSAGKGADGWLTCLLFIQFACVLFIEWVHQKLVHRKISF